MGLPFESMIADNIPGCRTWLTRIWTYTFIDDVIPEINRYVAPPDVVEVDGDDLTLSEGAGEMEGTDGSGEVEGTEAARAGECTGPGFSKVEGVGFLSSDGVDIGESMGSVLICVTCTDDNSSSLSESTIAVSVLKKEKQIYKIIQFSKGYSLTLLIGLCSACYLLVAMRYEDGRSESKIFTTSIPFTASTSPTRITRNNRLVIAVYREY